MNWIGALAVAVSMFCVWKYSEETQMGLSVTQILRILLITVILLLADIAFAHPNAFTGSTTIRCTFGDAGNRRYVIFGEKSLALTAPVHCTNLAAGFDEEKDKHAFSNPGLGGIPQYLIT